MKFFEITSELATSFLLPRHYSGRRPSISVAFGWFTDDMELKAVCTFGKPASHSLCIGVCGVEWEDNVYELNRLCREEDLEEPLSKFVAECLRRLKPRNWIVVSYSDTQMHHNGYIYQACNFMYTGCTKERTDMYTASGKHSRHYSSEDQTGYRKVRSPKHRYVYFCTNSRKLKSEWGKALKYPICGYPKGDNLNYKLGDYIKDQVVEDAKFNGDVVSLPRNDSTQMILPF